MRGEVATALTPARAMNFASALGTYIKGKSIVVATDTRISSEMFKHAVTSALLSCGCNVIHAGIISAPELHFTVPQLKADAGLLIGAGHHPMGWNALVPVAANGAFYNQIQLQELLDIYHSRRYDCKPWDEVGIETEISTNQQHPYLHTLSQMLDTDLIASGNFTVVTDFCNGSGAKIANRFANRLGIKMIPLNDTLSGVLPHNPEPRPRSSVQVQSIVKALEADIGFVFNSDMSRTAIVTNTGETLSEEYTFPLVADQILSNASKQMSVVTNWCTTKTLDDIVEKHNATLHKVQVGESIIIDRMLELKADLSGDGSGSAAFNNHIYAYDNFMVMGVILEAMAKQKCTSAELAASLPRYHIIKKTIPCSSTHAYTCLRNFRDAFPDAVVSDEDGFRFDWPDGWAHLRASMTEPLVRMIVEFNSKEKAEDKAFQIRGMLERMIA